jgi:membrane protein
METIYRPEPLRPLGIAMTHTLVQRHTTPKGPRAVRKLFVQTYTDWMEAGVDRMGAALAYYALLSIAPMLILVIRVLSLIWDGEAIRGELVRYLQGFMGPRAAEAIQAMIQNSAWQGGGWIASLLGFLTLAWGATLVVAELQASMDSLWKIKQPSGLRAILKQRSSAFILIVTAGFLFLISMLINTALAALGKFFGGSLPVPEWILQAANSLLSLLLNAALCALLFKSIPKVPLEWRDVLPGAIFTAVLLTAGKTAIGLYLGKAGLDSTFGAAGSFVVIMVWVYYSAQLFFFGAEFTRVYANQFGSRPQPPPE